MKKSFPLSVVLETIYLFDIPQPIAVRSFSTTNENLMVLMYHVFPNYGNQDFPYMVLKDSAKKLLIPELKKQFPQLASLDVSGVRSRKDWVALLTAQAAIVGDSVEISHSKVMKKKPRQRKLKKWRRRLNKKGQCTKCLQIPQTIDGDCACTGD